MLDPRPHTTVVFLRSSGSSLKNDHRQRRLPSSWTGHIKVLPLAAPHLTQEVACVQRRPPAYHHEGGEILWRRKRSSTKRGRRNQNWWERWPGSAAYKEQPSSRPSQPSRPPWLSKRSKHNCESVEQIVSAINQQQQVATAAVAARTITGNGQLRHQSRGTPPPRLAEGPQLRLRVVGRVPRGEDEGGSTASANFSRGTTVPRSSLTAFRLVEAPELLEAQRALPPLF